MAKQATTFFTYNTPHGPVTLRASAKGLCEVAFNDDALEGKRTPSGITNQAANELQEYLAGKRRNFDVPLDLQGSAFQKAVWTEVANIYYGQSSTAAQIAAALGKPNSQRSVGTALRACRLAPFIPTHRVVAPNATGKQARLLRGFAALERRETAG